MVIIGIDPGLKGGIVCLDLFYLPSRITAIKMPAFYKEIDVNQIKSLIVGGFIHTQEIQKRRQEITLKPITSDWLG